MWGDSLESHWRNRFFSVEQKSPCPSSRKLDPEQAMIKEVEEMIGIHYNNLLGGSTLHHLPAAESPARFGRVSTPHIGSFFYWVPSS